MSGQASGGTAFESTAVAREGERRSSLQNPLVRLSPVLPNLRLEAIVIKLIPTRCTRLLRLHQPRSLGFTWQALSGIPGRRVNENNDSIALSDGRTTEIVPRNMLIRRSGHQELSPRVGMSIHPDGSRAPLCVRNMVLSKAPAASQPSSARSARSRGTGRTWATHSKCNASRAPLGWLHKSASCRAVGAVQWGWTLGWGSRSEREM